MTILSKICVLALVVQAAVALPHNMNNRNSTDQPRDEVDGHILNDLKEHIARGDLASMNASAVNSDLKKIFSRGETEDDTKDVASTIKQILSPPVNPADHGAWFNDILENGRWNASATRNQTLHKREESIFDEIAAHKEDKNEIDPLFRIRPTATLGSAPDIRPQDDDKEGLQDDVSYLYKMASGKNGSPSKTHATASPTEAAIEGAAAAFTTGYTSSQTTGFTSKTTFVVSEVTNPRAGFNAPTETAAIQGPTETAAPKEQTEFGASPVDEAEEQQQVETSPTKEETNGPKYISPKNSLRAKMNETKNAYGSVEKRAQYDQQWADFYNKAGAYAGLDYNPQEYLKEYEKTLPESQRPCNQPIQQPQPALEDKPIIVPAPQHPGSQPQQHAPKPQDDAPIIIPAPQRPCPHQAPKPQQPAQAPDSGQQGQPGEEKFEDFVMFVPKDKSLGSEPYMLPANEYNPETPPQRLPPGVKPPPPPVSRGQAPEGGGLKPETIKQANAPVNVPLPVQENKSEAPEDKPEAPLAKPAGPVGGQLSEAPHSLPDWFPTRPGNLRKRNAPKEKRCVGCSDWRHFEELPTSYGPTSSGEQDPESLLPAEMGRLYRSCDANGCDTPRAPVEDAFKPHPERALVGLHGSGNSQASSPHGSPPRDYLSLGRFKGRLPSFKRPEPEYPECHEPNGPCPGYEYFKQPYPEPQHPPCEPAYGPCPKYEHPQSEYHPVVHTGDYSQDEFQPEHYPEHRQYEPEHHEPECHTCGPHDGSYTAHPEYHPSPYPEYSHPHIESGSPHEPQEPCPECVHPHLQYHPEPEPERHAGEQPSEPASQLEHPEYTQLVESAPQHEEPCYTCEQPDKYSPRPTEPMSEEPCQSCQQPLEPMPPTGSPEHHSQQFGPVPPSETHPPHPHDTSSEPQAQSDEPCHSCQQPPASESQPEKSVGGPNFKEPEPEHPPQDGSYPFADSAPSQPSPEPQPAEPCHTCEQPEQPGPQAEQPSGGPNFKQPQPEHTPQDGSYPIHGPESQGPQSFASAPAPETEPQPYGGPNFKQPQPVHPPQDGSFPFEDPSAPQPPPESAGPPPEPVSPPPETAGHPPSGAHVHPDGSYSFDPIEHPEQYPEHQPPQPEPKPSVPWHFPSWAMKQPAKAEPPADVPAPEPQPEQHPPQPYEPQPAPEQGGCPCEQGQEPQDPSGSSCAC